VSRTGDATFTVRTSTWFPQRMELEDGRRFTREVDVEELSCGADSIRGFVSQLYADTSLVRLVPLAATWEPVPENRRPVFEASCAYLLGSFAAVLPRSFGSDAVDEAPQLANRAAALEALSREYPPQMVGAGVRGEVVVRFLVTAEGTVDPATLALMSLNHVAFAEPAFRVVASLRFHPARFGGSAVPVWVTQPVTFQPR
jgi:TonB family protein